MTCLTAVPTKIIEVVWGGGFKVVSTTGKRGSVRYLVSYCLHFSCPTISLSLSFFNSSSILPRHTLNQSAEVLMA